MSSDSQVSNLESISAGDVDGLVHEIFAGRVKQHVEAFSPTSQMFQRAGPGDDYSLQGEKLVGSAQLNFAGNALGTDGNLPDHMYQNPQEWETTPGRRYVRRALDNFESARAQRGRGSFEDLEGYIFDQLWEAFGYMEIRHAVGSSTGTLAVVSSRDSGTKVTLKDGYGHTGFDPMTQLEPGFTIAWVDVSDSNNIGGAAKISSYDPANKTITIDSNATWEPSNNIASGDLIVMATTNDTTSSYFATERNNAWNGCLDLIDPDDDNTTVLGINEDNNRRWRPYRKASSTFDHLEVQEFIRQLQTKSTSPVNPNTHSLVGSGAVEAELARTLDGYQQQMTMGRELKGGYQAVQIGRQELVVDPYQIHDVLYALSRQDLYKVDVGGDAGIFARDGSRFQRLADFDGVEFYARDYGQTFLDRRNRCGALTGITLSNVNADDYTPSPNY